MKLASTIVLGLGTVCCAAVCQAASDSAQPVFTKQTQFRIPYHYDAAEMQRLGAREIRLYTSIDRGVHWQHVRSVQPVAGRFDFQAQGDGEYWFAVRTLDASNQLHPQGNITEAGLKVIVDSQPPVLEISLTQTAPGQVQLSWTASDENLDPTKLRLEYIQSGAANWQQVSIVPQPSGQTSWSVPRGGFVAVRGSIADRAANVGRAQQQLQIEAAKPGGATPTGLDLHEPIASNPQQQPEVNPMLRVERPQPNVPEFPEVPRDKPFGPFPQAAQSAAQPGADAGFAKPDEMVIKQRPTGRTVSERSVTQPVVERDDTVASAEKSQPEQSSGEQRIVNTRRFQIGYELDDVGPSGVNSVELFVTEDDGRKWWKYGNDFDRQSPFQVDVPADGRYGFVLRVRNGAGLSDDPPRPGQKPEFSVTVDATPPTAELMPIQQSRQAQPKQVLIRWNVRDANLAENPIALEYALDPRGPWQSISDWRSNDGSHVWTVGAEVPGRFYVRLKARDAAGNVTQVSTPQPVALDLSKPSARIVDIESLKTPGFQR